MAHNHQNSVRVCSPPSRRMIAWVEALDLLDLHVPHQLTVYLELQSCYVEKDVLEWLQKGNVCSIWLLGNPWTQQIRQASKHVNREGRTRLPRVQISAASSPLSRPRVRPP
jgi:hypothetical protein